jgi:TM2 domain-containing membrane protein YozV
MQLYITKGVQQIGPFSEEELRKQLDCGEAKYTDLAWHEGCADWVPISEILPSKPVPISPPQPEDLPAITNAANAEIEKPQQIAKGTVLDSNNAVPPALKPSSAPPSSPVSPPLGPTAYTKDQKDKKLISGILAILLGWLGVHKFYLGYKVEGFTMLVCGLGGFLFLCGLPTMVVCIIGVVEGIIYSKKTRDEFMKTYVVGRKGWF